MLSVLLNKIFPSFLVQVHFNTQMEFKVFVAVLVHRPGNDGFVGSIRHGGPMDLFLIPVSEPRLVYHNPWYVQSCI